MNTTAHPRTPPATLSSPAHALRPGTRLGDFEIHSTLGQGGFSIVYLATDLRLGREVAIKEYIPAELAGREVDRTVRVRSEQHRGGFEAGLTCFINEARLLAQFKHPALVEVLHFWEENGTAYMVMPYYRGRTLRQALRDDPDSGGEQWLKSTLGPVLDVLSLLHERSVFHRDVAPDNILVLEDGRAVLLDLGAAREIVGQQDGGVTVVVKPGYAPLEQYSGEFSLPQGAWTDLYAFGAVLHFAVTGTPPQASISRVMKDGYEPLAKRRFHGYSPGFLAGIDAALALQPAQRPQTVAGLRSLLGMGLPGSAPVDDPGLRAADRAPHAYDEEPITAIVSADELARIVSEMRGEAPADPPTRRPEPAGKPVQADAAPAAPPASSFSDVEDLMAGRLHGTPAADAERQADAAPASAAPAPAPSGSAIQSGKHLVPAALAIGAGAVLVAVAGIWWILSGEPSSGPALPPADAGVAAAIEPAGPTATGGAAASVEAAAPVPTPVEDLPWVRPADMAGYLPGTHDTLPPRAPASGGPWAVADAGTGGIELAGAATVDTEHLPLVDADLASAAAPETAAGDTGTDAPGAPVEPATAPPPPQRAPAAQPARAAAQAATGTVRLSVLPWAEVWVGGERRGTTPPLRELTLPAGTHRIELRNEAFATEVRTVEVGADAALFIEHRFVAAPAATEATTEADLAPADPTP